MAGGPKTRIKATTVGALQFLAVMKQEKWSQRYIAKNMDWSSPKLHRILSGKAEPTVREAFAIEQLTKGRVPAKSWTLDIAPTEQP